MCEFRCLYGFVWVKMLELVHARDCFDTFSDETTNVLNSCLFFSVWLMLFLVLH